MRVYELARELGLESKDVLARAQELGIDVKTASSGIDDDAAGLIRLAFDDDGSPAAAAEAAPDTGTDTVVEETAPAPPEPPVVEHVEDEVEDEDEAADLEGAPDLEEPRVRSIDVVPGVTVGEFADQARMGIGRVSRALMEMGELVSAAAPGPPDALELLGEALGIEVHVGEAPEPEPAPEEPAPPRRLVFDDDPDDLRPRPPVVTVMGHVDHGKTKLLDTIRRANVVAGEAGGITQHIGAYQVQRNSSYITFIDTPGHEAFTSLRARGANVTDIVILVVAADDGVMPQTVEAINHAKAAEVPIIVAINKVDLPASDPYAVRAQLTEHGLVVEELGGDVLNAEISALEGLGIDQLLELIELVAELEEFTSNPEAPASGTVIESELDKGRGPVATVVVQRGTLRVGDDLVAGVVAGRARAMFDENGKQVKEAPPSTPVLVMGWSDVPEAGDFFEVMEDEKQARAVAQERLDERRAETLVVPSSQDRLTMLLEQLRSSDMTELRVIIKADTHGSLEAIRDAALKIKREDGQVVIIHGAVGGITENDVVLAEASEAIIFGFNVRPDAPARRAAEARGIEMRTHRIIYELLDEVEGLLLGQLAPEEQEILLGVAEVRATFRAPRYGTVAGCYVTEGEMHRNAKVRLVRDGVVVYDGQIASLRRFKEDVPTVSAGFECGIGLDRFRDIKEGDQLESYQVREVART